MNIRQLIEKTRTFRRFDESREITPEELTALVDLARLSASGANRQPLKYIIVTDPLLREEVFPCLAWAGYLKEWAGPAHGERPMGYIVILGDTAVHSSFGVDHGIASQSIMLGATEAGLGGCIIQSIERERLRKVLGTERRYEILLVLALGRPAEQVVIEPVSGGDVKYWRDEKGVHHVPKRSLEEIIIKR